MSKQDINNDSESETGDIEHDENGLPDTLTVDMFENHILNKIEDHKKQQFIKEAYQKKREKYILKNELYQDNDKRKKCTDILKSIGYTKLLKNNITEQTDIDDDLEELTIIKQTLQDNETQIRYQKKKIEEYEDLLKRKQAEFENFRRRTFREREEFQKTATQKVIEELLLIVDHFEKALDSSKDQTEKSILYDGFVLIEKQLKKLLENNDVKIIESVGGEFDPNLHEAMQIDESNQEYPVDTVIQEWQKGYFLGEKVIRHAKVVVAKGTFSEQKSDLSAELNIPTRFEIGQFEKDILNKLEDKQKQQMIREAYLENENEYILKKEILKDDLHKQKILEIFQSIGYEIN